MIGAIGAAYALWRAWRDRRAPPTTRQWIGVVRADSAITAAELNDLGRRMAEAFRTPGVSPPVTLPPPVLRWEFRDDVPSRADARDAAERALEREVESRVYVRGEGDTRPNGVTRRRRD